MTALPLITQDSFPRLEYFYEKNNIFLLCEIVRQWYSVMKEQCYFNSTCQLSHPTSSILSVTGATTRVSSLISEITLPVTSSNDVGNGSFTTITEEIETTTIVYSNNPLLSNALFISGVISSVLGLILLTSFIILTKRRCQERNQSHSFNRIYLNPLYRAESPYFVGDVEESHI